MFENFAGKKFLIVDDDPDLREIMVDLFLESGAIVQSAESGCAAYSMILQEKFDCVVSDIRMPNGDGIELADKLLKWQSDWKPMIFIYSGFSDLTAERAKELGITWVFEKPIDQNSMFKIIASYLP